MLARVEAFECDDVIRSAHISREREHGIDARVVVVVVVVIDDDGGDGMLLHLPGIVVPAVTPARRHICRANADDIVNACDVPAPLPAVGSDGSAGGGVADADADAAAGCIATVGRTEGSTTGRNPSSDPHIFSASGLSSPVYPTLSAYMMPTPFTPAAAHAAYLAFKVVGLSYASACIAPAPSVHRSHMLSVSLSTAARSLLLLFRKDCM